MFLTTISNHFNFFANKTLRLRMVKKCRDLYIQNHVHCVKEFTGENSTTSMDCAETELLHSVNDIETLEYV